MNVKIEKNGTLLAVWKVKNKTEMRESVLTCRWLHEITSIAYGKKRYTMADIYAGRAAK